MIWFLYIAKAKTGRLYTGISTNPSTRIVKHNSGLGARMAIQQGPFSLLYVSDPFPNKSEARRREIQVKGWTVAKKYKLITGEWK